MVVIVGMKNMLHFMVNNHRETLRYSGLMEKLARHGAQYMMEDE